MTRQEIVDSVSKLTAEQERQWMFDLGAQLTISARGAYTMPEEKGNVLRLIGFNELQHQIYGCSRDLRYGRVWTRMQRCRTQSPDSTRTKVSKAVVDSGVTPHDHELTP